VSDIDPAPQNRRTHIKLDHFHALLQQLSQVIREGGKQAIAGKGISYRGRSIADFGHGLLLFAGKRSTNDRPVKSFHAANEEYRSLQAKGG
jgi:hypothetical protein